MLNCSSLRCNSTSEAQIEFTKIKLVTAEILLDTAVANWTIFPGDSMWYWNKIKWMFVTWVHKSGVYWLSVYRSVSWYCFLRLGAGWMPILMEYMEAWSLQNLVKINGTLSEKMIAKVARRILTGLDYLHNTTHIVHCDIKPANLLVNHSMEVKIADFGVSRIIDLASDESHGSNASFITLHLLRKNL